MGMSSEPTRSLGEKVEGPGTSQIVVNPNPHILMLSNVQPFLGVSLQIL